MTNSVSGCDRSHAQRKLSPRSSIAVRSMKKNPMKTGNWMSIGRQPAAGLTLLSFITLRVCSFNLEGLSLYFSFTAASCGWMACMRFIERVLAAVSGQKRPLMMTVMAMMHQPYEGMNWCRPLRLSRSPLAKNPVKPVRSMTRSSCGSSRDSVKYSFGPA